MAVPRELRACALLVGRPHRPETPAPWLLFALGTTLFAAGELVA